MAQDRQAPFGLRMPPPLKERVKQAAHREGRSLNAQIVQHLREIYQPDQAKEASA